MVLALLTIVLLQAAQEVTALWPTPPPNQYDDAYDARLFEAWGGYEVALGARDAHVAPQPPPLRPKAWRVIEATSSEAEARALLLREHVVGSGMLLPELTSCAATMPDRGELAGSFVCASTGFETEHAEIRFLRAPGAEIVFVNGDGFVGDPDKRGWLGVPVALRAGANAVLAVGIADGFEFELWKPMTRIVMGSWAVQVTGTDPWPHPWDYLYVPLFNASTEPAEFIHFHYDHACSTGTLPGLGEWHDGPEAVPLGLGLGMSYLFNAGEEVPQGPQLLAPAVTFANGDAHGERRLLLLRSDAPRPRWPAPARRSWLPRGLATLIVERSGDDMLDAQALAVARFCQQRLWERSGEFVPLLFADRYDRDHPDPPGGGQDQSQVVRFGRLDHGEGVLHAGPDSDARGAPFGIRASDAVAMRLVYAVDPFFSTLDPRGESWSLP